MVCVPSSQRLPYQQSICIIEPLDLACAHWCNICSDPSGTRWPSSVREVCETSGSLTVVRATSRAHSITRESAQVKSIAMLDTDMALESFLGGEAALASAAVSHDPPIPSDRYRSHP